MSLSFCCGANSVAHNTDLQISNGLDVPVKPDKAQGMTEGADNESAIKPARRRLDPDQSRTMILDATERLMRSEGYGAISARRVAAEAGLKAPLVHYYYRTADDLLLAFYRRTADESRARLEAALASDQPLHALWALNSSAERNALAAEFMALANHRKIIRAEIAKNVTVTRALQSVVIARALAAMSPEEVFDPAVATVVLASIGYGLTLEGLVGVTEGHAKTRAFIEATIDRVECPTK